MTDQLTSNERAQICSFYKDGIHRVAKYIDGYRCRCQPGITHAPSPELLSELRRLAESEGFHSLSDAADKLQGMSELLSDIKNVFAGDAAPNWVNRYETTMLRGHYLDRIDWALGLAGDRPTAPEQVHNEQCVCGAKGMSSICDPCNKFVPEADSPRDCDECGHWEGCHVK